MRPSKDIAAFRAILKESKNIIAVAGAGLSAASGIPTFRDAGGLWKTYDFMSLATPTAFTANPSRVWQFYHERRESALNAKPNAAHLALATISNPELLKNIAPSAKFTLITQNVDGLSTKAFQEACPGLKSNIYEMHGRLFDTLCTNCGDCEHNTQSPICPALKATSAKDPVREIPLEDLPRCSKCRGLLRPGVVWFEEIPHHLDEIEKIVEEADLALIVGTSSTVYPAAGYAYMVAEQGGTVAVFNLQRTEGDEDYAQFLFLGPCEETLPQVLFGDL